MATQQSNPIHSVITFRNSQGEKARGTLIKLTRAMVVLEVYNPYSIVQLSEVLQELTIHRDSRPVYQGKAVVSNLVNTGLMLIVSATLVDVWLDIADLKPGKILRNEVGRFVEDWKENSSALIPEYELSIGKIRNFLQEFSRWLEQGEAVAGINNENPPLELRENFFRDVDEGAFLTINELFTEFDQVANEVPEDDLMLHKNYAKQEIHPLTMCSPFMHRTYTKPLGYAGDYEMVNMILRNEASGTNTYARIIDSVLLRSGTAEAHRNRIDRLVDHLEREASRVTAENRPFRVLNIACGPAGEIQRFISNSEFSDNLQIDLLDFNDETIEFARRKIEEARGKANRRTEFNFIHDSIHSLLKRAGGRADNTFGPEGYDFIYCAGLFDYLSDKVCTRLVRLFCREVKPGGLVVCTNVSTDHSVKGTLEHLQDWYLILRDPAAFGKMADPYPFEVVAEKTGINIFLEIRI